MKMLGVITILAATLIALASLADVARAADGKDVFQAKCQMCHGAAGTGNEALAKAMKIELTRLDLTKHETRAKSEPELTVTVKAGKGSMPAFDGKLGDADIKAVVRFIRSLSK